jgi:formylglycine-generating enzyme required for sulfatase activity/WD40 repeat protein
LRQPNICPVFDVGQIDGKHYISMAYIEGRPLSAFIQPDKPQTERQILIVIRKLALALQEAHDHGIVHRDLKPANIMVDKKGEPIIMDFGLAQQTRREGDIRLTQTGNILGTPAYMSPEQVEGEPENIGPPTDQYSLGVILYELLTRQLPFRGSVIAVMGQILTKDVTPPSQLRPDVDPRIEAACMKMMAKKPSERFASLKAVADELATILKKPAAKTTSSQADANASQVRQSLKPKAMTESDLASLEELARKCLARRDYEQAIQVIERIPEEKRNAGLAALLDNARGKPAEIAFGEGGAARIGILDQFRRPFNDGGWIAWSVLAFGGAVFAVMTGVIVIYLRKTAIVIDSDDPNMVVAVKGSKVEITGSTTKVVQEPASAPGPKNTQQLPPTFKNNLGMEFVLVPKGKSWLGGGGGSTGVREVVIVHDFYLGKYEVTQEEWEKMARTTPSYFSRTGGGKALVKDIADAELRRFPVETVSWDDAQVFLERLNKEEKDAGWIYRLPKEAEWEYACRGGPLSDKLDSAYDFYFDKPTNQLLPEQANFDKRLNRTCKVGSYPPNRLGLYDMHGNVWEWCDNVEKTANGTSSREPRGGGWSTLPVSCTAAFRLGPARWEGRVGLRVARVPVDKPGDSGEHGEHTPSPSASENKATLPLTPSQDQRGLSNGEKGQSAIRVLLGHQARVRHLLFTPDGSRLISASNSNHDELKGGKNVNEPGNDNTVRVWVAGTGKQIRKFFVKEGFGYGPQGIAVSPDGRYVAACTSWDWGRSYTQPRVFVWDIAAGKRKYHFPLPGDRATRAVGFSPDGQTLYALRSGRGLHSWTMVDGKDSGKIDLEKQNPGEAPFATIFTSGCRYILGGLWGGHVRLWDRETGTEVRSFDGPAKVATGVAMSPDGAHILSSAGDFSVRMWETESGRQVFCMDNLDSNISCVAFSPDGKGFMTGGADGAVRVFDVATRKELVRFDGHTANVNCVAYSPDGRLAASASDDKSVRLWQLP